MPEFHGFLHWFQWFLIAMAIGQIGGGTIKNIYKKDDK